MQLKEIKVGAPYTFKSNIYGPTAIHVTAIYNEVVHFSIDGGEASRQVREFPILADGYFALAHRIEKRTQQATADQVAKAADKAMTAPRGKNTIREVPGVGKVAVVTTDQPAKPDLSDDNSTWTLSQLKAHAKKIGMSTGTKLNRKADLIAAIKAYKSKEITF